MIVSRARLTFHKLRFSGEMFYRKKYHYAVTVPIDLLERIWNGPLISPARALRNALRAARNGARSARFLTDLFLAALREYSPTLSEYWS